MSNVNNTSAGYVDLLTGTFFADTPHLDKFRSVAKTIAKIDAEERRELLDGQNAEYRRIHAEIQSAAETVATIVAAYQQLGHHHTTAAKLLEVLDTCQKEFETIAGECVA